MRGLVLGLLFLAVGSALAAACSAPQAKASGKVTTMTEATVQVNAIARLDTAAPAVLETATFALG